ncbi:acyl-CoA:lysophosphatidylglycerol acyltransferase 1-like isoform X2 [Haliotis rufescens]|uniref:acyl-CoA:lysophosphatidylglycerol acyltransferase 1-like isoform X2 n=1 Tax=Haliotis rufescens TaxID=6454 RepID=UPI001EAFB81D|nr:acyl-CoA:lysophosphatidylglycerol acyltransferase 1-like isoform X2 [Haliotis rufescens]
MMVDLLQCMTLVLQYCRYTVRFSLVLFTNVYAISSYCVWLLLLWPVRVLQPSFYWKLETVLFKGLLAMVTTWFFTAGYRIVESGDELSVLYEKEALLLINHQSTGDVPSIMASLHGRQRVGGTLMWIMDEMFRFTHFGAASTLRKDFFIRQGKAFREQQLLKLHSHLVSDYVALDRKWIVLFPEGGFLYKLKDSNKKYAEKNNYPVWNHITLPRVGAVKVVLESLADGLSSPIDKGESSLKISDKDAFHGSLLQWIIDVTIVYPKGDPLTLVNIGAGSWSASDVLLHFRAYPVSEVPKDEEGMKQWLFQRFAEKEMMMEEYYRHGTPLSQTDHQKRLLARRKDGAYHFDGFHVVFFNLFYLLSFYCQFLLIWKPIFICMSHAFIH